MKFNNNDGILVSDLYNEYKGTCPKAEQYSKELITLPIHLDISNEDITYITNNLKSIINE